MLDDVAGAGFSWSPTNKFDLYTHILLQIYHTINGSCGLLVWEWDTLLSLVISVYSQ